MFNIESSAPLEELNSLITMDDGQEVEMCRGGAHVYDSDEFCMENSETLTEDTNVEYFNEEVEEEEQEENLLVDDNICCEMEEVNQQGQEDTHYDRNLTKIMENTSRTLRIDTSFNTASIESSQTLSVTDCDEEVLPSPSSTSPSTYNSVSVTETPSSCSTPTNLEQTDNSSGERASHTVSTTTRPVIPKLNFKRSTSPTGRRVNKVASSSSARPPSAQSRREESQTSMKRAKASTPIFKQTISRPSSALSSRPNSTRSISSNNNSFMSTGSSWSQRAPSREKVTRLFSQQKIISKTSARPSSAPMNRSFQETINSLDYNRIKTSLEGQGMKYKEDGPIIHLENFNQFNYKQKIIITSPRSIEACMRLGISARELIYKPEEHFQEKGISDDLAKMRWAHYEQKRKEKLVSARQERMKIIAMEENLDQEAPTSRRADEDDSLLNKSLQQSFLSFDTLLSAEIIKKKKEIEAEQKLEEIRRKEQRIREEREKELKRIEKIRHKRLQETAELQRRLQEKQEKELDEKRAWIELKDQAQNQKLKHAYEMRKKISQQLIQQKTEKVKNAQQIAEMNMKQKLEEVEQKLREDEMKKAIFEENRKRAIDSIRLKSQHKEQKILEAKRKAEDVVQEKVKKILESQEEMDRKRRELEERRRIEEQLKKDQLLEREMKKKTNILNAQEEYSRRVQDLVQKQEMSEKLSQEVLKQQQKNIEKKIEEQKLKEMDRKDNIERMKRIEQFKKLHILTNLEEKKQRVEAIQTGKSLLFERRVKHKMIVERARKIIESLRPETLSDACDVKQLVYDALAQEGFSLGDWESFQRSLSPTRSTPSPKRGPRAGASPSNTATNSSMHLSPIRLAYPNSPTSRKV